MRVVSLASGSKGNAYCYEAEGAVLLVDCGICGRTLEKRCAVVGVDVSRIVAIVFTHDHDDHTDGLAVFHKRHPEVAIFANAMTAETVARKKGLDESDFACFENGQDFEVGPFAVHPFATPHDATDSVGYLIRAGGVTAFHGTDIGTPLDSVGLQLAEADVAVLESNHDPVMLRTSGRPPSLIQRIAGPRGHLTNDDACELVRRFASPKLKRLALAHLSRDCNAPHLAERAMQETLAAMNRADVALKILSQDEVVEV